MIKGFTLGAKKYSVRYVTTSESTNLGMALAPTCSVVIQTHWDNREVPEDSQEQTLFHEVVHCIFTEIGREDLSKDEQLVQSFSLLMHQFVRSVR